MESVQGNVPSGATLEVTDDIFAVVFCSIANVSKWMSVSFSNLNKMQIESRDVI